MTRALYALRIAQHGLHWVSQGFAMAHSGHEYRAFVRKLRHDDMGMP